MGLPQLLSPAHYNLLTLAIASAIFVDFLFVLFLPFRTC